MLIKLGNFVSEIPTRYPTKKKDKNDRYKLTPGDIFPQINHNIMWNFVNRYIAKNPQRSQWLESCGIQLMGSGMHQTVIVSSTANIYLDTFPAGDIELSLIWDYVSCSKKRKDNCLRTPEASSDTASKRSRYGGGICSVKPFTEQHSESQTRIASKLSQIAQQGIRAELGDTSTTNVQAVMLAVSTNFSKGLSKYCVNEGILDNARRMLQHFYGKTITGDMDMYMRGLQRMEKRIAERGMVNSKFNVDNLKRSLQATHRCGHVDD